MRTITIPIIILPSRVPSPVISPHSLPSTSTSSTRTWNLIYTSSVLSFYSSSLFLSLSLFLFIVHSSSTIPLQHLLHNSHLVSFYPSSLFIRVHRPFIIHRSPFATSLSIYQATKRLFSFFLALMSLNKISAFSICPNSSAMIANPMKFPSSFTWKVGPWRTSSSGDNALFLR